MWYEVFRIADAKKPKYLFLENVKGLLNHNQGKSFVTIMETICELGYVVDFTLLNSKFWGVPQNRERVFILAIREDLLDKKMVI
jgi:DNA (cytosine-5)-methyltransferase 1